MPKHAHGPTCNGKDDPTFCEMVHAMVQLYCLAEDVEHGTLVNVAAQTVDDVFTLTIGIGPELTDAVFPDGHEHLTVIIPGQGMN